MVPAILVTWRKSTPDSLGWGWGGGIGGVGGGVEGVFMVGGVGVGGGGVWVCVEFTSPQHAPVLVGSLSPCV